jgi:hypothetical protein
MPEGGASPQRRVAGKFHLPAYSISFPAHLLECLTRQSVQTPIATIGREEAQ